MAALPAPLLVWVSPAPRPRPGDKLPLKLESYFQSARRSGGGECEVEPGPEPGTYLVCFHLEQDKNRVKSRENHALEIDGKSLKIFIQADSEVEDHGESQPTPQSSGRSSTSGFSQLQKKSDKKQLGEKHDASSSSRAFTEKIFLHVSATLNTDLFTKQERQQVTTLCPNLKIEKNSSNDGIEKVTGDYADIEKVYHYFDELRIKNDQYTDFSHSERNDLEDVNENGLDEVNNIEVPSALYEYFNHVYEEQIKELQQRFNVKIKSKEDDKGLTSVSFISVGSSGSVERAQQSFITDFQKGIADLKQEKVSLTNSSQLNETLLKLNTRFRSLLAKIEGNTVILRGPANEILAAKKFLEEKNVNSPLEKPMKITSDAYTYRNGIEVDSVGLKLLETILSKEIEVINQTFDTIMENKGSPQSQKACIIFKPKNKDSDMSVHAYESFINAFQKASAMITEKDLCLKLSSDQKKQLNKYFNKLQLENPGIILYKKEEKLRLKGLPDLLHAAEKHIRSFLYTEGPVKIKEGTPLIYGTSYRGATGTSLDADDDGKMNRVLPKEQPRPKLAGGGEAKDVCAICMDKIHQKEVLQKCKHEFCKACIQEAMKYKPACPVCNTFYGLIQGNQPEGTMSVSKFPFPILGYPQCGSITIEYRMQGGVQTKNHPNPGRRYSGTNRTAYLPDNKEGREILQLLRRAFDQRLIFTVGQSRTSGANDVITWNDIHHKTSMHGGPEAFGYPDPNYLKRVREELKAKGIE
ncbi:E3 ubiquitin-protein ligase DTX3L [Trachemys scripta elegans]|uniref:E3 ubiquitin-protein ligase DTX3L n=1 Tax=Trachemys scripta elegans TaxID=31138 RepID=UPI001557BBF0|nr:E3 ubiquitin-protein ligase DTX3L [Trachemys scripta elegans]